MNTIMKKIQRDNVMNKKSRAWGSPSRYIQGIGELNRLPEHTKKYGEKAGAIIDSFFFDSLSKRLGDLYAEKDKKFYAVKYDKEVTREYIDSVVDTMKIVNPDVIVGIGGGKSIDSAKSVAAKMKLPLIVVPTSVSTDAPTSAMAIYYNDQHEHVGFEYFLKNPDLVLIDSQIIADAPVRFLVSGMGDALATYFEAKTSVKSDCENYICTESGKYRYTDTALIIAKACFDTIMKYGRYAKTSNELHIVTEALERVIEANTLMSGIGFENVGCAASHCVCNGLTNAVNGEKNLHGEKVAFGVLCQLVAENADPAVLEELLEFYYEVGLPMTLKDMNIEKTDDNFKMIAGNPETTEWVKEPVSITPNSVINYVKMADALGEAYKNKRGEI